MNNFFFNNGHEPLDYKSFITPQLKTTGSFKVLRWKTRSRLVAMFEKEQWAFGKEIVELAGLEDFEPILQ